MNKPASPSAGASSPSRQVFQRSQSTLCHCTFEPRLWRAANASRNACAAVYATEPRPPSTALSEENNRQKSSARPSRTCSSTAAARSRGRNWASASHGPVSMIDWKARSTPTAWTTP